MRVRAYPADEGGCGHYRLIWPCRALAAHGYDVDVVLPSEPVERQLQAEWGTGLDGVKRLVDVEAPDADVVVLQRPLQSHLADAVTMLQAKGVSVVVEVDDDFTALSPRNVAWRSVHPKANPDRNWQHLARACAQADLVTVTTPALAERYGRHGRVAVIPNYVPERYLTVDREPHEGVWVGWSGSVDTHPDDLQVTRGGVARAVEGAGARFAVVGTGKGVQQRLGLAEPLAAAGWRTIEEYPEAVAQLDVGIVPLEQSAFNEAKSALKGLEMAALGVPFVASPTGPYRRLAECGIGLIADKPKRWKQLVERLVVDVDFRAEQADRARGVARMLTVENACGQWWQHWQGAVNAVCAR